MKIEWWNDMLMFASKYEVVVPCHTIICGIKEAWIEGDY